jgi:hypothetical protein
VNPVPFIPQAERIEPVRTVHRQHAIQVIQFMLDQLRAVGLEVLLLRVGLLVLIVHPDPVGA